MEKINYYYMNKIKERIPVEHVGNTKDYDTLFIIIIVSICYYFYYL